MEKYRDLAESIIKYVGGKENINSLTHCITRLRFQLKDEDLADDEALKAMEGIVTIMKSGGQYQVVIGNHVPKVYEQVCLVGGFRDSEGTVATTQKKHKNILDAFIDTISGVFQPILSVMTAAGMIKGFNILFSVLNLYSTKSGTYMIMNGIGDAIFMFMPIMLGYTSAKKFGVKPMLGLVIGAAICYPTIQATALSSLEGATPIFTYFAETSFATNAYIDFLGIPVISMDYTSTIIPIILIVYFASKIQRLFDRIIPEVLKFFLVPMFTMLISVTIGLLLLGPLATFGSNLIGQIILAIRDLSPMIAGAVVAFSWQILVVFGLHWGIIPIYINNIMTMGFDNVMMPFFGATFAQFAVVVAIMIKTKDKKLKQLCIPASISAFFGISEPAIYGVTLPLKKPFLISCIASGIAGAFYGFFNLRKFIMGGSSFFELPGMIDPNANDFNNVIIAVIGIVISLSIAFILTMLLFKDKKEETIHVESQDLLKDDINSLIRKQIITAPIEGDIIALGDVNDAAFSSGALGKGIAIMPSSGRVVSPCDGIVTTLFPTQHAIGITSDSGVEVLIHIGMDTVQLEGKGFNAHIKQGDHVHHGQAVLDFDQDLIKDAGYSLITPIIITNTHSYLDIIETSKLHVSINDELLEIVE